MLMAPSAGRTGAVDQPSAQAGWDAALLDLYASQRPSLVRLAVLLTDDRGVKSGKVRKTPLMRVEHEGVYAMVGSEGGAPRDPAWVANLRAAPDQVTVQDGPEPWDGVAREITGEEKARWWERAVAAYPTYAAYQEKTDRDIPVFVVERRA